jgi:hypothetical protein
MNEPKHKAQMNPADRALFQQSIEDALLAIIASQGQAVTIPVEHIEQIARSHRIVVSTVFDDHDNKLVRFEAQKIKLVEVNGTAVLQ